MGIDLYLRKFMFQLILENHIIVILTAGETILNKIDYCSVLYQNIMTPKYLIKLKKQIKIYIL